MYILFICCEPVDLMCPLATHGAYPINEESTEAVIVLSRKMQEIITYFNWQNGEPVFTR